MTKSPTFHPETWQEVHGKFRKASWTVYQTSLSLLWSVGRRKPKEKEEGMMVVMVMIPAGCFRRLKRFTSCVIIEHSSFTANSDTRRSYDRSGQQGETIPETRLGHDGSLCKPGTWTQCRRIACGPSRVLSKGCHPLIIDWQEREIIGRKLRWLSFRRRGV